MCIAKYKKGILGVLAVFALAAPALAQEATPEAVLPVEQAVPAEVAPQTETSTAEAEQSEDGGEIEPNDIGPIVFTGGELAAIKSAREARGKTRPPTPEELAAVPSEPKVKPPPEQREIRLGGIVYTSSQDWMIWINGKIVTPRAIPKEVLDLQVYSGYVELKWFDEYSNQIYPLRLRPHERFNIDTRIFLPG